MIAAYGTPEESPTESIWAAKSEMEGVLPARATLPEVAILVDQVKALNLKLEVLETRNKKLLDDNIGLEKRLAEKDAKIVALEEQLKRKEEPLVELPVLGESMESEKRAASKYGFLWKPEITVPSFSATALFVTLFTMTAKGQCKRTYLLLSILLIFHI